MLTDAIAVSLGCWLYHFWCRHKRITWSPAWWSLVWSRKSSCLVTYQHICMIISFSLVDLLSAHLVAFCEPFSANFLCFFTVMVTDCLHFFHLYFECNSLAKKQTKFTINKVKDGFIALFIHLLNFSLDIAIHYENSFGHNNHQVNIWYRDSPNSHQTNDTNG